MKRALTVLLACAAAGPLRGAGDAAFHFEYDLAPHLARAGCAAADCHGGATGRGGFKLSLFATSARADYEAITQELDGRRIDQVDPARSLLLRKPTRQMKHKGGRVIESGSDAYRAIESWIRDGAPFSRGDRGTLSGLDLAVTTQSDGRHAIVTARFEREDETEVSEEVTSRARFESTDDRVATVDRDGLIEIHGPGEAWILARFGTHSARFPILEPFAVVSEPYPVDPATSNGFWRKKLSELGLEPVPPADEYRLLRRLYFDLTGRPPAPDEIAAYLRQPPANRVAVTAETLLAADEFADQLARHLWRWFEVPSSSEDLRHTSDLNARLRDELRSFAVRDESFLAFAASMLDTPRRREFVQRFGDPRDRAEFVGRAHLGMSIGCARCHNHPADRWSQAQHLQFSALFADPRPGTGAEGAIAMSPGKFFLPGDGQAIEPALLPIGLSTGRVDRKADHGAQLAAFLRGEARPAFARNAANRFLGMFLGTHLVDAPDDHRLSNPARHEPYLAALAHEFEAGGYRVRPIVQSIVTSPLYALDSTPPGGGSLRGDPQLRYLARRAPRAMTGDEFLRAVASALGVNSPQGETADTPLAAQLQLLNSGMLQEWLQSPGNQVDAIFEFESEPAEQLSALYLLILTRPPRPEERAEFLPLLDGVSDSRAAGRDLAFALFASREFSSIR